jgi:hypothetical protein
MEAGNFVPDVQRLLALGQGLYDLLGGLWPLVDMDSFEAVTGAKLDGWLVRTVAGMMVVIGAVLIRDASRGMIPGSMKIVAAGISLVLGLVALFGAMSDRIHQLYLIDGLVHLGFVAGWIISSVVIIRGR